MLQRKRAQEEREGNNNMNGTQSSRTKAPSTSGTPIAFVSYQGPHRRTTAATRRLIHQQAMKEIGKARRKPKEDKFIVLDVSLLDGSFPEVRAVEDTDERATPSWWLGVRWTLTDGLNLMTKFNVELDGVGKMLLANVFLDDDGQQRPVRDAWFSVGLTDKAAFLTILSNSALHLSSKRKGGLLADETTAAVKYQTEAVSLISRRLEDIAAAKNKRRDISDETIGAVSGLVCNADIRGSKTDWETHLRGLQELVQLRGGIGTLDANETLRVTLSWVELQGAFMFDVEPLYPIPRRWQCRAPEYPVNEQQRQARSWDTLHDAWEADFLCEPQWLALFEEMARFSHAATPLSSSPPHGSRRDHLSGDDGVWTNSMIHKLLSFRPLQDADGTHSSPAAASSRVQESIRLGCLLYMAPVWRFFGVAPVVPGALLAKLRSVLPEAAGTGAQQPWGRLWAMELWVLYVGATEALGGPLEAWFVERLVAVCRAHGIQSWAQAAGVVRDVLWFAWVFESRHEQLGEMTNSRLFATDTEYTAALN